MRTTPIKSWKKIILNDLQTVSIDLIDTIPRPAMVILEGDLGAGKTTLTQHFARNFLGGNQDTLGVAEITSPTYSLVNEFGAMAHADLYRLESPEELVHLELGLYLDEKEYFFVEWGAKYIDILATEIPVEWGLFLLKITSNPIVEGASEGSRNIELFSVEE